MSVTFCPFPLQVITPLGEGYVVYVTDGKMWENDCVTVALCDGGQWRHFSSADIKSYHNQTYGIQKKEVAEV